MSNSGDIFDLAVIGGGINGAGIARDAAGRGAKVLLLERGDLAQGTSSASTKLIHGGLRYLEHYEFGLVREGLGERERLWAIAPHLIRPLRFVLPYAKGMRPRWLLRLGLFLYDHLGGRKALPPTESIDLRRHPAGVPLKPEFRRGFAYSDCRVDDARLVVLNARDAADRGAQVLPRTEVTGLARESGLWVLTTSGGTFRARAVVNAAGPAVLSLLDRAHEHADFGMRLVRGSHIVVPRLFEHEFAYFFQLPDGRIFFAIPYARDFTLIGTTDRDHTGSLADVRASDEEVAYLCAGANQYFRRAISPADVVWTYAGVRPLLDDHSGKPEAATRGYRLDLSDEDEGAPMLTVFGGKITTYRHLAEEAMVTLAARLPVLAGPGWTDGAPLPGGDFPMEGLPELIARLAARYPFLPADQVERLAGAYGTSAETVLGDAASLSELGRDFGHRLSEREVRYLIEREWARSADDILWRRTKLGLRFTSAEAEALAGWLAAFGPI
jgi:glycerol-3-phosphate dehydrogenase